MHVAQAWHITNCPSLNTDRLNFRTTTQIKLETRRDENHGRNYKLHIMQVSTRAGLEKVKCAIDYN